jgi:hypothetical protein
MEAQMKCSLTFLSLHSNGIGKVDSGSIQRFKAEKRTDIVCSFFWWQGRELNPRPRAYESPALPLSYPAIWPIPKDYTRKEGYSSRSRHDNRDAL